MSKTESLNEALYEKAKALVEREGMALCSKLQRELGIGYNQAARLIAKLKENDVLEEPNNKGVHHLKINRA